MKLVQLVEITDNGEFSRATTATYFDHQGVLRTAAVDEPRLNFPPALVAPIPTSSGGWRAGPSLLLPAAPPAPVDDAVGDDVADVEFLVEAAATNLMVQSQDLTVGWTLTNATVAANSSTAPDATTSADRLRPSTTSTAAHKASKLASASVPAGATVGASVFLRAAGFSTATFRCAPAGEAAGFEMIVDLEEGDIISSGTFGSGATLSGAELYGLPSGWYRLELVGAVAAVAAYGLVVYVGDGATAYAGDASAGVDVWGWQLERDRVTSYIPTATAAVTRAADVGTPALISNVPEANPVWSAVTTYSSGQIVRGTGSLAHTQFVSLQSSNTGHELSEAAWWLEIGATERWKPFDEAVSSPAAVSDNMTYIMVVPERANSMTLLGLEANTLRLTITDPQEGKVLDETYSLLDDSAIVDSYTYCFNDIERVTEKYIEDLAAFPEAQVRVTLLDQGATVRLGECVVGRQVEVGEVQYDASLGFQDYSVKVRNDFGKYSFVERGFTSIADFDVFVDTDRADAIVKLFAKYRSRPFVVVGSETFTSTIIYGVAKDFGLVISGPEVSHYALRMESLI